MKVKLWLVVIITALLSSSLWSKQRFGETLCHNDDYFCIKIKPKDSWYTLFPQAEARDVVRRINRMNIALRAGMVIAIPKKLDQLSIYDVSPFPRYIDATGEKTIYVSQTHLAWGAYNEEGELIWWGPISSGIASCRAENCTTPTGAFRIIRKQDIDCISSAFPRRIDGDHGGAGMPYCMHFFRGFALHGSVELPGYRASHGCVRMFTEDARWLNEEFVSTAEEDGKGTRVILDAPLSKY